MSADRLGLLGLLSLLACPAPPPSPPAPRPATPSPAAGAAAPRVIADEHGFTPGEVRLPRGGPGRLVFRRTSDDTCATAVVFPELGIEEELPLGRDVAVTVPAGEARTYSFQCGMGMYRSRVVVR